MTRLKKVFLSVSLCLLLLGFLWVKEHRPLSLNDTYPDLSSVSGQNGEIAGDSQESFNNTKDRVLLALAGLYQRAWKTLHPGENSSDAEDSSLLKMISPEERNSMEEATDRVWKNLSH